jgi:hypothetical protein
VDAVGRHHVVVVDVEREGEVVAAPAFDVERIVLIEQRCRAALMDQPNLVLVAAVVVDRLGFGDDRLGGIEWEVPAQRTRWRNPELVAGLDHQQRRLGLWDVTPGACLRQIHPVAVAVTQRPELRLQQAGPVVDEAQQIAVDVADEIRHRLVASGQRDPAVRVGEHQERPTVGVGCVAGLELARQHVNGTQGTLCPVGRGVVAAVQVCGPAGEPAAAEFVVFLALEVSVQATRRLAFSQVNEGFHLRLQGCDGIQDNRN